MTNPSEPFLRAKAIQHTLGAAHPIQLGSTIEFLNASHATDFLNGLGVVLGTVVSIAGRTGAVVLSTADLSDADALATVEYVDGRFTDLTALAPTTLDTLKEIADRIVDDESSVAAISDSLAGKANTTLSNLSNISTARGNLGLGTAATVTLNASNRFVTDAQIAAWNAAASPVPPLPVWTYTGGAIGNGLLTTDSSGVEATTTINLSGVTSYGTEALGDALEQAGAPFIVLFTNLASGKPNSFLVSSLSRSTETGVVTLVVTSCTNSESAWSGSYGVSFLPVSSIAEALAAASAAQADATAALSGSAYDASAREFANTAQASVNALANAEGSFGELPLGILIANAQSAGDTAQSTANSAQMLAIAVAAKIAAAAGVIPPPNRSGSPRSISDPPTQEEMLYLSDSIMAILAALA